MNLSYITFHRPIMYRTWRQLATQPRVLHFVEKYPRRPYCRTGKVVVPCLGTLLLSVQLLSLPTIYQLKLTRSEKSSQKSQQQLMCLWLLQEKRSENVQGLQCQPEMLKCVIKVCMNLIKNNNTSRYKIPVSTRPDDHPAALYNY